MVPAHGAMWWGKQKFMAQWPSLRGPGGGPWSLVAVALGHSNEASGKPGTGAALQLLSCSERGVVPFEGVLPATQIFLMRTLW